jgi:hypothetical protein
MSWPASPAGSVWRVFDLARRRTELPVVICIDVEPDDRTFDPSDPRPWRGFERLVELLPGLRRRLSEATQAPAAFTWCLRMDPQVAEAWGSPTWVADTYANALAELTASGDELGLHTHNWRLEPAERHWIADHEDQAWGEHCLATGFDAFETAFGRACTVHRGGNGFLSRAMFSSLDARGVHVDLTVEPGLHYPGALPGEQTRGPGPDYRNVPTVPYRSSPSMFPAPDRRSRSGPVLLPLMSAPGRHFFRRSPLYLPSRSSRFVPRLAAELIRASPRVLALAVRSDAVLGAGWDTIAHNLEHLGRHHRVCFVTATEAIEPLGE